MKKIISLFLALSMFLSLTACSCNHKFSDATCTEPKICEKCGETEGDALGHIWLDATLTEAKTCFRCAETDGENLYDQSGSWIDALQLFFSDSFSVAGSETSGYHLSFNEVENIDMFFDDVLTACHFASAHCDEIGAEELVFELERECVITCSLSDPYSLPQTTLIIHGTSLLADDIQSIYNAYFVRAGLNHH